MHRTRRFYAESGKKFSPVELDPKGKQFRLRSGTDPLAAVPEDSELQREQSLSWEKFGEQISFQLPLAEGTRRWSTDTLFSVPVADSTVQSSEESDGGDYLSPTGGDDPTMAEAIATATRRKVRAMIMEADEDVLPFTNKKVNLECVGKLCGLSAMAILQARNCRRPTWI